MRYAQIRLTETELNEFKKAAIDAKLTLEAFIKTAVFEKIISDTTKPEEFSSKTSYTGENKDGKKR